jgi:hypothetical protein
VVAGTSGPTRPPEAPGGFAPRTLIWLSAIGAGSLLFALLLSGGGDRASGRPVARPSTFSWSALGHRALADLLRASGLGVVARQSQDGRGLGPRRPLILAEPDPARLAADSPQDAADTRYGGFAERAREARSHGAPLVVVLPKWQGRPLPDHPEWVGPLQLLPLGEVARVLEAMPAAPWPAVTVYRRSLVACRDAEHGVPLDLDLMPAQLLAPHAGLLPIVVCGGGLLIAWQAAGSSAVVVIADPDLLNNQGLGRVGHAALIHDLLARRLRARGVVFDETLHGFRRGTGLLALALGPPLLPATLQMVLLFALVVWSGAGRFGKPLPPAAGLGAGKEVLLANTADLLTLGGHAGDSLARYYRLTLRAVAGSLFLPPDLPEPELLARLEDLAATRRVTRRIGPLARRVRHLPERAPAAAGRAVALAHQLYLWRLEMTDGSGKHP